MLIGITLFLQLKDELHDDMMSSLEEYGGEDQDGVTDGWDWIQRKVWLIYTHFQLSLLVRSLLYAILCVFAQIYRQFFCSWSINCPDLAAVTLAVHSLLCVTCPCHLMYYVSRSPVWQLTYWNFPQTSLFSKYNERFPLKIYLTFLTTVLYTKMSLKALNRIHQKALLHMCNFLP